MAKFALVASIEAAPGRRDELVPLLLAHRARCLKDEPGTLLFEVMLPRDEQTKIMLYEVYTDEAAFNAHSSGPSIARLRKEGGEMMVKVSSTRGTVAE